MKNEYLHFLQFAFRTNERTMNADFLAMLGGSGPNVTTSRRDEGKSILNFKAGKMTAELQEVGDI